MKIHLKNGIDKLLFGMKQNNVTAIYGKPTREYEDDENNIVFLYTTQKWALTFYKEEDFRLGYIVSSNKDLELFENKIIGRNANDVKQELIKEGLKKWDMELFDSFENHLNEDNWVTLQTEFNEVIKFEIGAIINDDDEFEWKFLN